MSGRESSGRNRTVGNTGQSSDSMAALGGKEGWHGTGYNIPTSTAMEKGSGNRGYGNDKMGPLGELSRDWTRYAEGKTPGPPTSPIIPTVASRGNVGAGKWKSGGESDTANNQWRDCLGDPQKPGRP